MYTRFRTRLQEREEGFTLIELLVVIIIIGILAAIAIPVFLSQRQKAQDASAESDARNAAISMETYYTDNNNYNAGAGVLADANTALRSLGYNGADLTGIVEDGNAFCVQTTSASANVFHYTGGTPTVAGVTTGLGTGACPANLT